MSLEIRPSPALTRTLLFRGQPVEAVTPTGGSEWQEVMDLLGAVDELVAYRETDSLLKRAVELVRERIGLERAAFYLRDPKTPRLILRGTWGTDAKGQTTDERGLHHECTLDDYEALLRTQQNGELWLYFENAAHYAEVEEQGSSIGHGWMVVTPLVSSGEVVGVMHSDSAITHAAVDNAKQARAAVFCGLLANLLVNRRDGVGWRPLSDEAPGATLAERALRALERDPVVTGERIAQEMGISPGHLARSFKMEMGVSLVEYRNRLRLERFLRSVQSGNESLLRAALEAGFGSYAQFFRVYRKLLGTTPREHLGARRTRAARARRIWHDEPNHSGPPLAAARKR